MTLSKRSPPAIAGAILLIVLSIVALWFWHPPTVTVLLVSLAASAFLADVVTAFFHFGFDYIFPHDFPILGPIAKEFHEHHTAPTLDPGNYAENLTKGAYGSLAASLLTLLVGRFTPHGTAADLVQSILTGLAIWTLFFHQMHSYAHMGSTLHPAVFQQNIEDISKISCPREQRRHLTLLFETVAIPRPIRILQRVGLTLDPIRHNLHHVRFERDFSSVNGWSDPFLNPLFGSWARRIKAKREAANL
jgi:hypothetical protein